MTAGPRPLCTSLEACWCPNCGRCTCDRAESMDDPDCPLHAPGSDHAEESAQVYPLPWEPLRRMVAGQGEREGNRTE